MDIDPAHYWPPVGPPPTPPVDYPEPPAPQHNSQPRVFLIVLAAFAAVLFMVAAVLFICTVIQAHRDQPGALANPVVTMTPVTVTTTATPPPAGDEVFLSALKLMGYPVPDQAGSIKIGHNICANLRSGHGVVGTSLIYLPELGNAPEGFNQADAVALVWASEDAYCPEQPRQ
jgi:hypothetical protein